MTVFFKCPKCREETVVTVVRQETDLPPNCAACGAEFGMNEEAEVLDLADAAAREPLDDDVR